MGLELRLEWYDTATLEFQGEESSKDLGGDESVLNALGTPAADNITMAVSTSLKIGSPPCSRIFNIKSI
jgi:hypothetical protein